MEPIEWITITEFVLMTYRARTVYSKLSDIIDAFKHYKLVYTHKRDWALGDAFMTRILALIAFSSIWRYLMDLGRQQTLTADASTAVPPLSNHEWFVSCMRYFDERYAENIRGSSPEQGYDPFLSAMMITYVEKAAPEWDLAIRREIWPNNGEIKPVTTLSTIIYAMHSGNNPLHKEAAVIAAVSDIVGRSFREVTKIKDLRVSTVYTNLCNMFADNSLREALGNHTKAKTVVEFNSSASHVLTAILMASERRQTPSFKPVTPRTILMPTIPPMGRRQSNSWITARTGYVLDTTLQGAFLKGRSEYNPDDIEALLLFSQQAGTPASVAKITKKKEEEKAKQNVLSQEEIQEQIREHLESEDPRAVRNKPKLIPVGKRSKHRD